MEWPDLVARVARDGAFSPWARAQVDRLARLGDPPAGWPADRAARARLRGALDGPCPDGFPAERFEAVLADAVDDARRELLAVDARLAPVADAVVDLVAAGGKRLRPGSRGGGGTRRRPSPRSTTATSPSSRGPRSRCSTRSPSSTTT